MNRARDWFRQARDPLNGRTVAELERDLAAVLAGRVQAAYLYGSVVSGQLHSGSDIDLIIVTESKRPFVERPLDFDDLFDRLPALQLLVYTAREFDRLTEDPSPGFWRSVVATMRRIVY